MMRSILVGILVLMVAGIGGVAGPWLFGALIDSGSRWSVFGGYLLGAALMLAAALIAARWSVAAGKAARPSRLAIAPSACSSWVVARRPTA